MHCVPGCVQQACGNALPPHQTEDPDATDATEGFLRDSRAAPGPVVLHEVLLAHVFAFLWLLQHTIGLQNIEFNSAQGHFLIVISVQQTNNHLSNILSHKTSHNHPVSVDEEVRFSRARAAEGDLLKAQLTVCNPPHVLCLEASQKMLQYQ